MDAFGQFATHWLRLVAVALTVFCAGHSGFVLGQEVRVQLTGAQEIPPVETSASGIGILSVAADKSVSGSVTVSGMSVTVAHIHEAGAGTTGLIIIPLTKTSDTVWTCRRGQNCPMHSTRVSRPAISTSTCTARRTRPEKFEAR
jgi:hypothetical protein